MMTTQYMVLHFSQNWMMDGLYIHRAPTLKAAKAYIQEFQGDDSHKNDTYEVVRLLQTGKARKRGKHYKLEPRNQK